jgi:hypothetical protein
MQTEPPPLDLAHLKALEARATPGDWVTFPRVTLADSAFLLALKNAFPQLCRELEAARVNTWSDRLQSESDLQDIKDAGEKIISLQSQLSKAEEERDRMQGTLTHALEALRRHIPEGHSSHPNPEYEIVCEVESALQTLSQTEGLVCHTCLCPPSECKCIALPVAEIDLKTGALVPQTEGREDHKEFLAWILQNCKIIHWPGGGHYPIEHAPAANKDGVMLLQMAMNKTGMYAKALYEPTPAPVSEKGGPA